MKEQNLIIYQTDDGTACVALYAREENIWLSQSQRAELFATSEKSISSHIINVLEERELEEGSVVKDYFATVADGKQYSVRHYARVGKYDEAVEQQEKAIALLSEKRKTSPEGTAYSRRLELYRKGNPFPPDE